MRLIGSLGPTFVSWTLVGQVHVRQAFPLTVIGGFLTLLSLPLGALVIFLRAWRPTQTAHLPLSPLRGEPYESKRAVFHRPLGIGLAADPDDGSRLRYTFKLIRQRQAAVKLHGVFAFRWTVLDCAPVSQFHRLPGGDSRALVGPSCKSPIKRQGITLTSVALETSVPDGRRRATISRDLPMSPWGSDCIFTASLPCSAYSL